MIARTWAGVAGSVLSLKCLGGRGTVAAWYDDAGRCIPRSRSSGAAIGNTVLPDADHRGVAVLHRSAPHRSGSARRSLEPLQAGHDAPNASIPLGIAEGADKNIRVTVASYSNPGQIGEIVPHK